MFRWNSTRRFVFQLILLFMIFTLSTVISLGIPVMVFFNRQVESQFRALIDQANQTTLALYENKNNQLANLSALIFERPTLNRLVLDVDNPDALSGYLDEFIDNANVDVILVCDKNIPIALAGDEIVQNLCSPPRFNTLTNVGGEVWLLSNGFNSPTANVDLHVVVGQKAVTIFEEFKRQSGLDYVLFIDDQLVMATALLGEIELPGSLSSSITHYEKLALYDEESSVNTHMAGVVPLVNQREITLLGLLDISILTTLSYDLRNILFGTLVLISFIGAIVAVFISRWVSHPLNQLARSAAALREGDLETPLSARSKIWEIDQLTNALEDARVSLKHSLDQLKLEKAWIENLLNAVVEGLLAIDEKMRITYASEAIERIADYQLTRIMGRSLDDIFTAPPGEDLFSHQLPGGTQSRRIPVLVGGREKLLAVSASRLVPPEAGNATRALVIRDVTDEERIHRLIGEFLANITHEFRTPLTALSASVELLLDQLPNLTMPEFQHLLYTINIGIIDLQSLIDNLIEAASIEAGRFKVNPQTIFLNIIVEDAIKIVDPIAQKQGLCLVNADQNLMVKVYADRRRTCQALVNLLSNAIKHSPERGVITVTSQVVKDDVICIEVSDEGEGVPQNQRNQLFNRFITPGTEFDGDQLGLGLGLSVVKAIIEAQNGTVGFRVNDPKGAVFWITLPKVKGGEN